VTVAVIGGTGLTQLENFTALHEKTITTPYGKTSAPIVTGEFFGREIMFLPRHGSNHSIAPHLINYRANIHALKEAGVTEIIAVNAVGGVTERMRPEVMAVPDQIIDYTSARQHTFFDGVDLPLDHIDFTQPFSECVRSKIIMAAQESAISIESSGVYGCTQGPRLETAAEVNRLRRDGCDLVGMTAMPEAALARELQIHYGSICLVVNYAAGLTNGIITMDDIRQVLDFGMHRVGELLAATLGRQ